MPPPSAILPPAWFVKKVLQRGLGVSTEEGFQRLKANPFRSQNGESAILGSEGILGGG
jgi:hypothetical protein